VLSSSATWVQALLMTAALSPSAAWAILPMALVAALSVAAIGLGLLRSQLGAMPEEPPAAQAGSALRLREALIAAAMLGGAALVVGNAQRHFGDAGLAIGTAMAALLDAQAPVVSLASLHSAGDLSSHRFETMVLVAISANTLTRCIVAAATGGRAYALRVAAGLLAGLSVAGLVAWLTAG
jgi:uncharacterized membrane protein (DUF4010 family)